MGQEFVTTNSTSIDATSISFGAPAATTIGTSATLLIASNTSRKKFIVRNCGTTTLYFGISNAVTTSTGIPLYPDESLSDEGICIYTGDVYFISSAAGGSARYSEAV